ALAVVVVLREDRDLVRLTGRDQRLAERAALLRVGRHEAELPRALLAVAEQGVAGLGEHLREALVDRGLAPRPVRRGAQADAAGEDALGDHLLEVCQRFLRVVLVVVRLDLDRPGLPVAERDAAFGVLDAEVGDRAVRGAVARSGGRPRQGRGDAEGERRVGDARARRRLAVVAFVAGVSAARTSAED